jgi:hypothetical protein
MRRRLLAAAGAAVISLAIIIPVAQAVVPDGRNQVLEFWTPVKYDQQGRPHPQPDTAEDGASVWSNDEVVTAKAHIGPNGTGPVGVKSWEVRIQPVSGGAPTTCREEIAPSNNAYPVDVYISCPWDTTRVLEQTLEVPSPKGEVEKQGYARNWRIRDLGPSLNGKYMIQVRVHSAGQTCGLVTCAPDPGKEADYELFQDANAQRWRETYAVNGIADPAQVANSFNPQTNRITVTWAPNPEPDVSYVVEEKVDGGAYQKIADVPGNATTYDRVIERPGKYQYNVAAVRPAGTAEDPSATKRSGFVATQAVDIAQVTPPTSAGPNGPDGSVDGGDPGVFMPSDPTTTTATGRGAPAKSSSSGRPGGFTAPRPGTSSRPTGSTARPGEEAEGEGPDDGYSATLDYGQQDGEIDELGEEEEEVASVIPGGVTVPRPRDTRALLIPMALGLLVFVFAMQMIVLLRRRPAMSTMEDDFGDWMGY